MAGLMRATAGAAGQVLLDPGWDIWGPAGGYIAAIALRAAGEAAPDGHRPLTLTGQFVRIARPGALDVAVEPIKIGSSALFAVTLSQAGRPVFLAQIWTSGRAMASHPVQPLMPEVPPPAGLRDQAEMAAERGIKLIDFWKNIEGRPINFRQHGDPLPDNTHQLRWIRFTDWAATDNPFLDAMRSTMLIDIGVWPGHWHRLTEPAQYGAPSLDIVVHYHDGVAASDWLLSDADTDVSGNGTISGRVRIWSDDGRCVATGSGHCLVVPAPTAG
jgi:acyl-CoA thioesterase